MRSLILLWLPLWLVYLGVGAAVSGIGFRHFDLSYSSLLVALLIPLIQACALLAVSALRSKRSPRPATEAIPKIRNAVTAILVAEIIALQVFWLTVGTGVGTTVEELTLRHLLVVQLAAVTLAVIVDAVARRTAVDSVTAAAIALPAGVAAAELVANPVAGIVNAVGLPPLAGTLTAVLLSLLALAGLILNAGRLQALPIAGRLADWGLAAFFGSAVIAVLMAHGGAQLGSFWLRLAGTGALLCTVLVTASLIQARREVPVREGPAQSLIWWTRPATRLAMLALLVTSYLGGWLLLTSIYGRTPGLVGEWEVRAVTIPTAQAGLMLLATLMNRADRRRS